MRVHPAKLALAGVLICGGLIAGTGAARAGSINGVGGTFTAYYDHELFTINFMRLTTAQATLLAKNSQQNTIFQSDPGLPGGQPFISVIDAIHADGFNPLWAEVQIAFTAGHTPRQLFSDDEIAAARASGEITLTPTNEMYRCSVIGAKPRLTAPLSGATRAPGSARAVGASNTGAAPGGRIPSWGGIKRIYR